MGRSASLSGKRILVTGATSGLGWEIAHQLTSQHGARVIAIGRREERLTALREGLTDRGPPIEICAADLTSEHGIAKALMIAQTDGLDGLILNAGMTYLGPFETADFATYERMISLNVTGNLRLIGGLLEVLKAGQARSQIMLVASLGGLAPLPYQAVYAGTKAMMVNFGVSLRAELKSTNIGVTVFAPGGILTEMTAIDGMRALQGAMAPPARVARQAITAYKGGRALVVPGAQNTVLAAAVKWLPRSWVATLMERTYAKALAEGKNR